MTVQGSKISAERNKSVAEQLATVSDKTPVAKLFEDITVSITRNGKKFRGLDVTGKDKEILRAISDPIFNAGSITNKTLQGKLVGTEWANGMTDKKFLRKSVARFHYFAPMVLLGGYPSSISMP
ncbi:hypothetical protein [Pseudobacteroides cellulosolvens]|uniref:Uncharacterized protein n=1 Tax=Pseudobacteroides cellulosolvens ATCC 35603 = DSM 2933 TaxID=398512 RepID=A0A0L6JK35_9FIRM|nr:hypothetical protein [Pseudobacteroides cellulosolvens]KNY26125.1 hypothetical protein Bccel_1387 [Pseudobacteroides cellulosolvens ATCC 35603 = DSM 2933]